MIRILKCRLFRIVYWGKRKQMKSVYPLYPERNDPNGQKLVTVADLDAFGEKMLTSIRQILSANSGAAPKKWLKSHQVRRLLNISPGTLQTLRSKGIIPFSKIEGTIYYDTTEIEKMMLSRAIPAIGNK